MTHHFPVRVYYEDTDAGGIVYYANYLRFAERARSEMLRATGFESAQMMDDFGAALAVRRCVVDYLKPARLDDLLDVETSVKAVRGASMELRQRFFCQGTALVNMEITLAFIDTLKGLPKRLPGPLKEAIAALMTPQ